MCSTTMYLSLVLLVLLVTDVLAARPNHYVIHEHRILPSSWIKGRRAPSDTRVSVKIALTQLNVDHAPEFLMAV